MTVLDFDRSRRPSLPAEAQRCVCGSEWFELRGTPEEPAAHGAVTLAADGHVTGFYGVPHCLDCGRSLFA